MLYPLICCESNGGPYQDRAFVSGVRFGQIQTWLQVDRWWSGYVQPELLPQLDLLAMNNGLSMKSKPWDEAPDEWASVVIGYRGDDERG